MADFRRVTDTLYVAPQIRPEDVAEAKALGVTLIVNNRPEGEEAGQPEGDRIASAAEAAGIAYLAVPVIGMPTPEQVGIMRAAVDAAQGKVLAFCRSGMRSISTWALGRAEAGSHDRDALLTLGRDAGYDLSRLPL